MNFFNNLKVKDTQTEMSNCKRNISSLIFAKLDQIQAKLSKVFSSSPINVNSQNIEKREWKREDFAQ